MTSDANGHDPVEPGDAGTTVFELILVMAVMSVVMAVFTASVLQVYRTASGTSSRAGVNSQLRTAFQRLDKEIRYASWIATPGKVGTTWYVEFADHAGGCGQLRLDTTTGVLLLVRWTPGSPPGAGPTGQAVASGLTVDNAVAPFVGQAAGTTVTGAGGVTFTPDYYLLRIRLTASAGGTVANLDDTFTALNTSRLTPTTNACQEGRP